MEKRHKEIMIALVSKLRHILVGTPTDYGFAPGDLDRELERLGIDREGEVTPIDALGDIHNGDGQTYRVAATQLNRLPEKQLRAARREIVERAAYTWINRLLALRAMEVRGLIYDTLRVSEDYSGLSERLYLLRLDSPEAATEADGGWWIVLKNACAELAKALPGLFALGDPDAALHPTPGALIQCIDLIGGKQPVLSNVTLSQLDATFADPDAIGWAYQFYQAEAKSEIDAKCKIGGKAASRAELAAKTQLFTEPYMVQWLLQNSLGRSCVEAYPQSTLPANWPYYIQPEPTSTQAETRFLMEELTLIDPCMGSGHFLRAAFDLFVAMYREQHPEMSAIQIADRILGQHLFGIDLDPRAAQLSALTLYLRAWEIVKAERRIGDMSLYIPPEMHLATTPTNLDRGSLERHIQRYPDDSVYRPLLEKVFEGLEQAETLGSLLRSHEYLDQAIADLQKPHTVAMAFSQAESDMLHDVAVLEHSDPKNLHKILLDRIATSFHSEANSTDDVSMALFGREAERGVRLLQVLDGLYAVVVTNPPYLGSAYMDESLRKYIATYYKAGKRDLYAAFILRCLQLCKLNGRVAMVTMHSWMFLSSFAELRALPEEKMTTEQKKSSFTGVLRETSIEALAHLGPHAFEEIGGEVVQSAMFTLANRLPNKKHSLDAYRLVGLPNSYEKANLLNKDFSKKIMCQSKQTVFLTIPLAPIVYWLPKTILELLGSSNNVGKIADPLRGLDTGDMPRFVRWWWETNNSPAWYPYVNGGSYRKWVGLRLYSVLWKHNGASIKAFPSSIVPNPQKYAEPGLTFSDMCSGSFNCRIKEHTDIFGVSGSAIFEKKRPLFEVAGVLNSRISSYILRAISPTPKFRTGYVRLLPYPEAQYFTHKVLSDNVKICIMLKSSIIVLDLVDRDYLEIFAHSNIIAQPSYRKEALLHSVEALNEKLVCDAYKLSKQDIQTIIDETGTPAGWHPLITSYDALPDLSDTLDDLAELPQELYDYLATHERITPDAQEMARIKANLQSLYEAGPDGKGVELEESEEVENEESEDEKTVAGAYIPIPTETFLEKLSVKMQLHPISVYWLLEELQATEMVRCLPEEKRLLEDRLSVLVLRLLGHRWPKQIEAFEPLPDWAEREGIIPLVPGTGQRTLAERVRERLHAEEGALGAQELERKLHELTEMDLEQWLRSRFFERHSSQFKKRPVAWHLASTPPKRGVGGKKKRGENVGPRTPAFACLLYYHACTGDALARIRTQYVEPLLQNARGKIDTNTLFTEDLASAFAQERIHELEEFVRRLRTIEESGFACRELQEIVAEEILDRWSGDGEQHAENKEAFQRSEESWHVDINDGVRVNITPLQLVGVLAKEVLNIKDAKKALGDRVRWRADERRWVREGKLPRCGWMDGRVPANSAWEERETQHTSGQQGQQPLLLPEVAGQDHKEVRS